MKQVNLRAFAKVLVLTVLGLFLSASTYAQITVKGLVKDDLGEPLPGAHVVVKGAPNNGAVTDMDGNFRLTCKKGATLVISYIGYASKEVAAAPNVTVSLADDSKMLNDVVVIGYGHAKKGDLTGSVSAMNPDEMSKGITNNASDMLVGKIAGVDVITSGGTPGAGAQIRIRGGSSLNASNDPLYVIDGMAIDNATATGMSNILANINPNDIETFTVLKDASATAIYGSRASNGVIIITTKKGKGGQAPQVSYTGNVTISKTQKRYDALNGDEYRALVGKIDGLDATKLGTANTDWQDQIFRTGISTNHNISINGGLKNMPYRVSAGYDSEQGIVKTSDMHRVNTSVNLAPSFFDKHLNFNITAKYTHEEDRYADASGAIGSALAIDPTRPVYDDSADGLRYFGGYYQPTANASFSDPTWKMTANTKGAQNPVALLENQHCYAYSNDFTGNIAVDYKIHGLEDLSIHGNFGAQVTGSRQDDATTNTSYSCNYYGWEGVTKYNKYSMTGNGYIQYAHNWNDKHNFDIMAGAEESHFHRNGWNAGQGTDPYTGEAYDVSQRDETAWATHNSLLSYFGRANYTLLDRYMFTATMRADGSSRFAKDHRWGYFPSAAFAWKISNEKFLKNVKWLDELKLRLGWGQTGQQDGIAEFGYTSVYTNSNSYAMYPFGKTYYTTQRPSAYYEDLTWETTTTYNAGLDFSAKNGRFTWSLDGYYRETKDLLNTVIIPVGTNFGSTLTKNIGSLKNYGVEFSFDVKPVVTKDFTWDLQYNVAWNHNEITSLVGGNGDSDYYIKTGETISRGNSTNIMANTVGQPTNSFFVYQQVYDENGKPIEGMYVDRNADGQINESDRYFYKKPAADVIMGLTTKFIYKRWDLSLAFHASLGNYVYYNYLSDKGAISASGLYSSSCFSNTFQEAVDLGFTGVGTEYYLSDYYVRNASYLKCSNITLGYSFPALKIAGKERLQGGRIYFTCQNPFIVTKYKGLDPEVSSGVDKNPYPRPLSFQVGVNLNF